MTCSKSSASFHPSETYFPSDFPDPEKSKQNIEMPFGTIYSKYDAASILELQIPCKNITQ